MEIWLNYIETERSKKGFDNKTVYFEVEQEPTLTEVTEYKEEADFTYLI